MAKSVNGKPGGTVASSVVNTVHGHMTIAEALELTLGQLRWRRRGVELRERRSSERISRETTKGQKQ